MSKDIALFIASARIWTTPQVDKEYECARVAIALAFEIEGWHQAREAYGKMHGHCAGLFEKAFEQSLAENCFVNSAIGNEWGTVIDLGGKDFDEQMFYGDHASEAVASFLNQAKKWMEPFYGTPIWSASESVFFMNESQAISLPLSTLGYRIRGKHQGEEMPHELAGLMSRIEADIIAAQAATAVGQWSTDRKSPSL